MLLTRRRLLKIVLSGGDQSEKAVKLQRLSAWSTLKRNLRKGVITNLEANTARLKCETCGRFLFSKAGYINHLKSHTQQLPQDILPPQPGVTTCVVCRKVCKSTTGLKRHMAVHKDIKAQKDTTPSFICHNCYKPCKSAAGLKSHLRGHRRRCKQKMTLKSKTAIICEVGI